MRASLRIDQGRCNGCQACVRSCPAEALAFVVSEERVEVTWDPGGCIFCGRCQAVCLQEAVRYEESLPLIFWAQRGNSGCKVGPFSMQTVWRGFWSEAREAAEMVDQFQRFAWAKRGELYPRCRQGETFRAQLVGKGEVE